LTLVREKNTKYVFGAFVQDTYVQGRGWVVGHPHTFVFTLGNITGKPAKLVAATGTGLDTWHDGCGLHLSNDLIAFCDTNLTVPTRFKQFARGYDGVLGRSLLSGVWDGKYTPDLMEVFAVTSA